MVKQKGFITLLALVLVLALVLAGCGSSSTPQDQNAGQDQNTGQNQATNQGGDKSNEGQQAGNAPSEMILATGGTAGTYYPLGGEIAQIISKETGIATTAQTSGASVENMRHIKDGSVDLAFTQTDIADYAAKGVEMFKDSKVDNLRGIGTLYPETIQIVTLADSGINSVNDLKGKKVSVGAPGSGTELNAKQILEVYGLTFDDLQAQHLDFGDSADGIQDGNIDAAFITAGAPTAAVEALSATKAVKIVPLDDDKIAALKEKYPYYADDTVPAGAYKGVDADVKTVAVRAMLVTRDDLDEQTIYNVTKALFENTDKITHAKGKLIKAETALDGMSLELHPGAAKYFKEKGLLK
jgi:hypothetical protein